MTPTTATMKPLHRVKVCGMTQPSQVDALASLGAIFAGFIFYSKSPRYVLNHMTMAQIKEIDTIKKVGVFVNATIEEVLHTVEECGLSMVQLHGDESPTFCATISKEVPVVKAFRVGDNDVLEEMVKPYEDVCSMFLFDTMGPGYGGTGKKFEWNILQQSKINKPYFLSGGIGLDDLQNLSLFAKDPVASALFAIDINSKFELQPGVKDLDKVATFINNSKSIL